MPRVKGDSGSAACPVIPRNPCWIPMGRSILFGRRTAKYVGFFAIDGKVRKILAMGGDRSEAVTATSWSVYGGHLGPIRDDPLLIGAPRALPGFGFGWNRSQGSHSGKR